MINYPATGKITAKIYLRYSNAIPKDINQDFGMDEFGPSGNNTPYFTVTVDLDKINRQPVKAKVVMSDYGKYIYYSIDSDESWNPGDKADTANRVQNATNLWEQAIFQAMSSTDQKKFENVFGSNMFVGYVLKRENDGWHIDGILKKDPPVYVVELYDRDTTEIRSVPWHMRFPRHFHQLWEVPLQQLPDSLHYALCPLHWDWILESLW